MAQIQPLCQVYTPKYRNLPTPYGPKTVSSQGQLSLPNEVLAAVGLQPGQAVYVVENEDPKGTILLVPEVIAGLKGAGGHPR